MSPRSTPRADLLNEQAKAYADLAAVTRKLAALEAADAGNSGADEYDSRNRLPPDCQSRDRFRRTVKLVPGARRVGHVWIVDRGAWQEFRTMRKAAPAPPPVLEAPPKYDDLMTPREALAAAGSRRIAARSH